ncbi:AraC family transcriptional regulator [Paenibacillus algicola]|uniref:AraC family transcriptional regulator n=1 Tax=Paenibacillus algicola TaxID=2565926 RepID=UPI001C2FE2DC|nr:AraC family transcriptional regulator [Paenibacillus algicola]
MRITLIIARYATTPLTWGGPVSRLTFNKLYYIQNGTGHITVDGASYYPKRGDLVFVPEGCEHSYSLLDAEPYTKYWCHFTANVASQPLSSLLSFPQILTVSDSQSVQLEGLFQRLIEAYEATDDPWSPLAVQASLLELLYFYFQSVEPSQLCIQMPETTNDMSMLLDHINGHLRERITLGELARVVNVHPHYLVRLFKAQFGFSPIQYVNLQRVNMAKALLSSTKVSIKSIADQAGFESPDYFTQVFKKHTGLSPTEYRNS